LNNFFGKLIGPGFQEGIGPKPIPVRAGVERVDFLKLYIEREVYPVPGIASRPHLTKISFT
jgi:hypothetical protein